MVLIGGNGMQSVDVIFTLHSVVGGPPTHIFVKDGAVADHHEYEMNSHLTVLINLGMGLQECFKNNLKVEVEWTSRSDFGLSWADIGRSLIYIKQMNNWMSTIAKEWRSQSHRPNNSSWVKNANCTSAVAKKIVTLCYNRAIVNPSALNKCYPGFSSMVYGETMLDQMEVIVDKLRLTKDDVFGDLGSGVGQLVAFVAAAARCRCFGIEINPQPARIANKLKEQFEGLMKHYRKEACELQLEEGDFLSDENLTLLKEATVLYMNNLAYDSKLMGRFINIIPELRNGTRIVCSKRISEERTTTERVADENGVTHFVPISRTLTARQLSKSPVDLFLDEYKLPLVKDPVSWSNGSGLQFVVFTVNHNKRKEIVKRGLTQFKSLPKDLVDALSVEIADADDKVESEKPARKSWRVFAFPEGDLVTLYTFFNGSLPKKHRGMDLGDMQKMWWDKEYYPAILVAKGSKEECEELIDDIAAEKRTWESLNIPNISTSLTNLCLYQVAGDHSDAEEAVEEEDKDDDERIIESSRKRRAADGVKEKRVKKRRESRSETKEGNDEEDKENRMA